MAELRDTVRKQLITEKVAWASNLSEWGVYVPHETDAVKESLIGDDTCIVSLISTFVFIVFLSFYRYLPQYQQQERSLRLNQSKKSLKSA